MILYDELFDLELAIKNWREEAREEGREEGYKDGREEGYKDGREEGIEIGTERKTVQFVRNLLARGHDVAEIAELVDVTLERVEEIASASGSNLSRGG